MRAASRHRSTASAWELVRSCTMRCCCSFSTHLGRPSCHLPITVQPKLVRMQRGADCTRRESVLSWVSSVQSHSTKDYMQNLGRGKSDANRAAGDGCNSGLDRIVWWPSSYMLPLWQAQGMHHNMPEYVIPEQATCWHCGKGRASLHA